MEEPRPSPLNILVAEDSLMNQQFATRLLKNAGHLVTLASNGREAVRALRSQHFDLVLMDIEMPEMDGLTATQTIRSEESDGCHTTILALTDNGDRQQCLNAGMDEWLPKPLSLPRLNRTLARVTGLTEA